MLEPQARKTSRDVVRDTFTAPRVGLLTWAIAAVFMATIGVASYQFGSRSLDPANDAQTIEAGVPLPSGGDIETTASIGRNTAVAVYNDPVDRRQSNRSNLEKSQIEVLQLQMVGLRRRLAALSEQNLAYSRRIAALEQEVARTKLLRTSKAAKEDKVASARFEPRPGVVVTNRTTERVEQAPEPAPAASKVDATRTNMSDAVETPRPHKENVARTQEVPPRKIEIYQPMPDRLAAPTAQHRDQGPVRLVSLPEPGDAPVSTGSIPAASAPVPEPFDARPTQTRLAPKVITPSNPAGQLNAGGDSQIKRSDFGAIIGHYSSRAGAAKAWADFKEQNEDRMRDLRPLLLERKTEEGGVALMLGPFANAADAAVACLHLLDVTELCRPALYAGDPLITAAEFRDTAF